MAFSARIITRSAPRSIEDRVASAAKNALECEGEVSFVDVLVRIGLLAPSHIDDWLHARIGSLEEAIQAHPEKTAAALQTLHAWAASHGLPAMEATYVRRTRAGVVELQLTRSADPDMERAWRAAFRSPVKTTKPERLPDLVVFQVLNNTACDECGATIAQNGFLFKEGPEALCLPCAGLADLEFLPSGDTALTRRASKHSTKKAVVVRFSRSRKRYERQGILAEHAAIEQAERECTADAPH